MKQQGDQKHIEELRERLYARGAHLRKTKRSSLSDDKKDIPTTWQKPPEKKQQPESKPVSQAIEPTKTSTPPISAPLSTQSEVPTTMAPKKRKRTYRLKLLGAALFFFVGAVIVSSLYVIYGGNAISGDNIAVSVNGPFTIGGGEIMQLQIGITNQNSVSIDSATLIVEYPLGTQSDGEESRELFVERLSLNTIASGETINIPLRAQVFGEENEELTIKASVEYRVKGSNATFFKDAEPLNFKISSSPIVVSIDSVKALSSGQETEVAITVRSNAPATLSDILVKAEYPTGFDFTSAQPDADSGRNVWIVDTLEPEESKTITIKGIFVGSKSQEYVMNFSVGVPNERDRMNLASVFAVASAEFEIEEPFLDVGITVNDAYNKEAVIASGENSNISIVIKNTLEDSLYDGVVEVLLSGNALSDFAVHVNEGFYDSNTRKITWDISSIPNLERILPGGTQTLVFNIVPTVRTLHTPQISIEANVRARRVSESSVTEELVGNATSVIKVESEVSVVSETGYSANGLSGSGPLPPVVGKKTTYTLSLMVQNGSNNLADSVVSATLPSYVTWTDVTMGGGVLLYNPSTRVVDWNIGPLGANKSATASFQVSILPSTSQIGKTPTLLGEQRLRAKDKFTQTILRTTQFAITTSLPTSAGFNESDGFVQATGN